MAKTKVSEWDATAANNTDVGGIGIRNADIVSNGAGAVREMMAQIKSGVATTDTANTFTTTQTIKRTLNMTSDGSGDAIINFYNSDGTTRAGDLYHAASDGTLRLEKRSSGGTVISSFTLGNALISAIGDLEVGVSAATGVVSAGRSYSNRNSRTVRGASIGAGVASTGMVASFIAGSSDTGGATVEIGRGANAGNFMTLYQGSTLAATVSVDGSGVTTWGTFCGGHWSQLHDGSKPDILPGTIMETIDEMCVWPGEQNAQLAKVKVSDTAGSKAVYGVFSGWDIGEEDTTNDMIVNSLGAYFVRIAAGETVAIGDLIESAGNGCGRVQADDIMRSRTVAKVTATHHTYDYPDGSYCVPATLHCG